MKTTTTIILTLLLSGTLHAQVDVRLFDRAEPGEVLNLMKKAGVDTSNLRWREDGSHAYLEDANGFALSAAIVQRKDTRETVSLHAAVPGFVFLSKYLDGGLQVGDPISKALTFDFASTPEGRGDPANNCRRTGLPDSQTYVIFENTAQYVGLEAENGIITWIFIHTR